MSSMGLIFLLPSALIPKISNNAQQCKRRCKWRSTFPPCSIPNLGDRLLDVRSAISNGLGLVMRPMLKSSMHASSNLSELASSRNLASKLQFLLYRSETNSSTQSVAELIHGMPFPAGGNSPTCQLANACVYRTADVNAKESNQPGATSQHLNA